MVKLDGGTWSAFELTTCEEYGNGGKQGAYRVPVGCQSKVARALRRVLLHHVPSFGAAQPAAAPLFDAMSSAMRWVKSQTLMLCGHSGATKIWE